MDWEKKPFEHSNKGLIKYIENIYELPKYKNELVNLENFGEKSVNIILDGIESSKQKEFRIVLPSLGLKEISFNVTDLLIQNGFDSIDKIFQLINEKNAKEKLMEIKGIGEEIADAIITQFKDPRIVERINKLRKYGLQFEQKKADIDTNLKQIFKDQVWCVTGTFKHFKPREKALEEVLKRGGKSTSSITSKTTHLLVGENPGSKIDKAKKLGIKIITEEEFIKLIKEN